jgi:hypothetical protein
VGAKQTITAVGDAITLPSTAVSCTVLLDADASYTLTSAPTLANGYNGQKVHITNVDDTDTITIQDQGTLASSNLRLDAATVAIGPRDSLTLMYSTDVGDWVQITPVVTVV